MESFYSWDWDLAMHVVEIEMWVSTNCLTKQSPIKYTLINNFTVEVWEMVELLDPEYEITLYLLVIFLLVGRFLVASRSKIRKCELIWLHSTLFLV